MDKSAGISDDPFLILEHAWQAHLKDDEGINTPQYHPKREEMRSPNGSEQSCFGDEPGQHYARNRTSRRLNLSSICISTIFQIEDEHLPRPLLKIYQYCLQRAHHQPDNPQNAATLRLCNYIFRKWHDTRAELNLIRDTMKIVVTFGRRFSDHIAHMDRAIDSCPVGKYQVWVTLLRKLKRDARGLSLGEYLSRQGHRGQEDPLYGLTLNLFDSADVFDDEGASYFSQIMKWPSLSYARQVILHLIRNLYKLSSSANASTLFNESVPSWAEELSPDNHINRSAMHEDRQLRQQILESLLKTSDDDDKFQSNNKQQNRSHATADQIIIIPVDNREATQDVASSTALMPVSDKDDDLISIDTHSFRQGMNMIYALPSAEPKITAQVRVADDCTDLSATAEIIDNESKLNELLSRSINPSPINENERESVNAMLTSTDLFDQPIILERTPSARMITNQVPTYYDNPSAQPDEDYTSQLIAMPDELSDSEEDDL